MALITCALGGGLIAVSLTGCLDRGGLASNDATSAPPDAGGKAAGQTGGAGGPGTGGASAGAAGGSTAGTGGEVWTGGTTGSGTGGVKGMGGTGGKDKEMCGAVCDIYCAYGNVVDAKGCPTCACKPKPDCAPTGGACVAMCPNGYATDPTTGCATCNCKPTACPTIACLVACPYGYTTNPATGCAACGCKPGPVCPTIACAPCPNGYVQDPATGCSSCECLPDDPNVCAATDCGPQPVEPVTLVCPAISAPAMPLPIVPPTPGPYVCQRSSIGKCGWHKSSCTVCSAVACKLNCDNGFKTGADGCPTCACNPPRPTPNATACASLADRASCATNGLCTWLQPGCMEPALAAAGCYGNSELGCTSDADCGQGHQCLKRFVNSCPPGATCPVCGQVQTICQ